MGAQNNNGSNTTYWKLKAKSSDTDPTAFFGKNTKTANGYEITERFNSFTGTLVSMEHSTYEYQGETKNKLSITLKDDDGTTNVIEAGFNSLTYSLLNCLANCNPGKIQMDLSLGKAKIVDGKAGKQYPNIWVKNNGEKVTWKYPIAELPRAKEVTVGKKKVKDDANVVEFWLKVLNSEIKPKLKNASADTFIATTQEEEDSLPF